MTIKYFCDKCAEELSGTFLECRNATGKTIADADGRSVNLNRVRHFHEECYARMSSEERNKAVEHMSISEALDALNRMKEPFQ